MSTGDISKPENLNFDIAEAKKHPKFQAFVQYTRKAEGLEDEWEFGSEGGDNLEDMVSWIMYLHKHNGSLAAPQPPASPAVSSQQEQEPTVPAVPAEDADVSGSAMLSDPATTATINGMSDVTVAVPHPPMALTCEQKSTGEDTSTPAFEQQQEQGQEQAAASANNHGTTSMPVPVVAAQEEHADQEATRKDESADKEQASASANQEHNETETAAAAPPPAPDAPQPKPAEKAPITVFTDPGESPRMPVVNAAVISTYLDPETNKLSGHARQSAFDKCYGNTRIVSRPSTAVVAEKLAVQADI